jgi:AmmeMemoRadiSam system protein A
MDIKTLLTKQEQVIILSYVRSVIAKELNRELSIDKALKGELYDTLGACFVTLQTKSKELRGCIGHIRPIEPLGDNLRNNALQAAFHDPRFSPLSSIEELNNLIIDISILSPLQTISSYKEFIIGTHGIILSQNNRSAVFLPQVAVEQNWDVPTTLTYLSQKAGLPPLAWQENQTTFQVFEALVFSEENHL